MQMSYKLQNVIQSNLKNVNVLVLGLAMHMSNNLYDTREFSLNSIEP
jgi:hypothetical protein